MYRSDELKPEPRRLDRVWTTLFLLGAGVGGRVSELLGVRRSDLERQRPHQAPIRFTHQVDRRGRRVELKARPPCPFRAASRSASSGTRRALLTGPRACVFGPGGLSQRNVLRDL
jgi:hypothetical protein